MRFANHISGKELVYIKNLKINKAKKKQFKIGQRN
jgi:hypothetical protein